MKWAYVFFLLAGLSAATQTRAQLLDEGRNELEQVQDSLKELTYQMINAPMAEERQNASDTFIPAFVDALKIKYSYEFPFDSLGQISIVYDKDSTFRIFSWAIAVSNIQYRFYGALQVNTKDGSLKLFPFFDNTFDIHNLDTIAGPQSWIGALYYNMIRTKYKDQTYYTLMGWCGYSLNTNKKLLEVLTFKNGQPVFGAPVFNFKNDTVSSGVKNRFFLEYKRDGGAGLNYDTDLDMIVYDHLVSLKGQREDKASLVPDGTYEGFKWVNGYWMHVPKVFHQAVEKPPIPRPLKFGNNIEGNNRK